MYLVFAGLSILNHVKNQWVSLATAVQQINQVNLIIIIYLQYAHSLPLYKIRHLHNILLILIQILCYLSVMEKNKVRSVATAKKTTHPVFHATPHPTTPQLIQSTPLCISSKVLTCINTTRIFTSGTLVFYKCYCI